MNLKKFFALGIIAALLSFVSGAFAAQTIGHGYRPENPGVVPPAETVQMPEEEVVMTVTKIAPQAVSNISPVISIDIVNTSITNSLKSQLQNINQSQADKILSNIKDNAKDATFVSTVTRLAQMVNPLNEVEAYDATNDNINMTPKDIPMVDQLSDATSRLATIAAENGRKILNQVVIAALPEMDLFNFKRDGIFFIPLPIFDSSLAGKKIIYNSCPSSSRWIPSSYSPDSENLGGSISAAALDIDVGDALFLDSNGNITDTVPDGKNGEIPGFVTVASYMELGYYYNPIISIPLDEVLASNIPTDTETVNTGVFSEFTALVTEGFSSYVSPALLDLMADEDYHRLDFNSDAIKIKRLGDGGWTDADNWEGLGMVPIAKMPAMDASDEDTTYKYIVNVSFDISGLNNRNLDNSSFAFYPNGFANGINNSGLAVYMNNGNALERVTSPAMLYSLSLSNGYIAFTIRGSDNELHPTLVVTGSTPRSSSSSGGCSLGLSGFGFVALSGFRLFYKKKSRHK